MVVSLKQAGVDLVKRILKVGIEGLGPVVGARDVAQQHMDRYGEPELAISKLRATHERVVGASGFATGLGGLVTLPVAVPTEMGVLYVYQGRLAAAIAHVNGYDVDSEKVRSVVLLSLLGSGGAEIAKQFGIDLTNKVAMQALQKVPGKVFIEINKKVGFRLITKAGTKGLVNMTKLVPVAGAVAGVGVNVASTRTVAEYAKKNFPAVEIPQHA